MRSVPRSMAASVFVCLCGAAHAEPARGSRILGADSCATSGCHGGAGPNRGAHSIWLNYDPHTSSAATLGNGRSKAMAAQMGLDGAAESKSCTICHAPNRQVDPSMFAAGADRAREMNSVSCANCHGGAENWILSHTRDDFPRDALAQLGMRQLGSAYQRANNCVACHQNLSDELVAAKHPPLVFELDGLLVAQPKHWHEEEGFSNARTWLVGQAVALRESAAQALREPGEIRTAEIEAIKELLRAAGAEFPGIGETLVSEADAYAKRVSAQPAKDGEALAILTRLAGNREPFGKGAFASVAEDHRMWAAGHYAERLALAIDRLNETCGKPIADGLVNDLFDAAMPPKAFDAAVSGGFSEKLGIVAQALSSAP
ncbi:hypothetical protein HZ994_17485 [Akkermansiaceae bacterium]|nr:hypothetical protein HZ994_17485 [Akkermansiaceae bacterium]